MTLVRCILSFTSLRPVMWRRTGMHYLQKMPTRQLFHPTAMLAGVPRLEMPPPMVLFSHYINSVAWAVGLSSRMKVLLVGWLSIRSALPLDPVRQRFEPQILLLNRLSISAIFVGGFWSLVFLFQMSIKLQLSTMTTMPAFNGCTTWPQKRCVTLSSAKFPFASGFKIRQFLSNISPGRQILPTSSPKKCTMAFVSVGSGFFLCHDYLPFWAHLSCKCITRINDHKIRFLHWRPMFLFLFVPPPTLRHLPVTNFAGWSQQPLIFQVLGTTSFVVPLV